MKMRLKQWCVITFLCGMAGYVIAEEITLTTYYPSPRGVYQELRTAGNVIFGDINVVPGARVHVVQTGAADALRVDDQAADASPFRIDQDGHVSIGGNLTIPTTQQIQTGTAAIYWDTANSRLVIRAN